MAHSKLSASGSFVPNALSGDFSAEIRLGYLYKNGKRIPIRGAMFTGNLFAMLDTMRMDGELHLARYKGPAVVRFDAGCHVAGF
jgi:predicted Zn-dependent protease